jgi:hypothetical protein
MQLTITLHTADHPDLAYYTVSTDDGRILYETSDPLDAALWAASEDPERIRLRWDEDDACYDPATVVPRITRLWKALHQPW